MGFNIPPSRRAREAETALAWAAAAAVRGDATAELLWGEVLEDGVPGLHDADRAEAARWYRKAWTNPAPGRPDVAARARERLGALIERYPGLRRAGDPP